MPPTDSLHIASSLDSSLGVMLADRIGPPAVASQPDALAQAVAWLESPVGVYLSIILLAMFLIWGGLATLRESVAYAVKKAFATADFHRKAFFDLQAQQLHLMGLLQRRDALYQEYQQALLLPFAEYDDWNQRNWKSFARNNLAMTEAVRPLTYADYCARVRGLNPRVALRPARISFNAPAAPKW